MNNPSKLKIWVQAARPQTLAAAFVPVCVGASLAFHDGHFNSVATIVALLCAFLIQIGTNFANDYFDFKKGADTDERLGFERATAKGYVSAQAMRKATAITMGAAFLLGLYLVWIGGWQILCLGILSIIFGLLYTGGPFPLGYNGLGDLFVFIFFGIVAVMGTYYVNALQWSIAALGASLAVGALCINILVVNNLRDVEQDRRAGKRTLGVIFGEQILRWEYSFMILLALTIPPYFYFQLNYNYFIFIPYLSIPFSGILLNTIWTEFDKRKLNKTLEHTAQYMTLYAVLFSGGIIADLL